MRRVTLSQTLVAEERIRGTKQRNETTLPMNGITSLCVPKSGLYAERRKAANEVSIHWSVLPRLVHSQLTPRTDPRFTFFGAHQIDTTKMSPQPTTITLDTLHGNAPTLSRNAHPTTHANGDLRRLVRCKQCKGIWYPGKILLLCFFFLGRTQKEAKLGHGG